jgi:fumarylacetoacetate (FAA) hydrolase
MLEVLSGGDPALKFLRAIETAFATGDFPDMETAEAAGMAYPLHQVRLLTPIPQPPSFRDFYAFEAHVLAAHRARNKPVPPEWYEIPVFYFSNPGAFFGGGENITIPGYTQAMDFELEVACVIGKPGIDIKVEQAEEHIFGLMILNDWSARDIQQRETRLGLGPAKAKDFATSAGPALVTLDELAPYRTTRPGVYNLTMTAHINGKTCSTGTLADIHYSFGEIIARASQAAWLRPGDVIGSGTVGSGCLLELTQGRGPWLQPGDLVELEIEGLGRLANRVVAA